MENLADDQVLGEQPAEVNLLFHRALREDLVVFVFWPTGPIREMST
jgi:glutaredoxin-related protein